MLRIIHQVHNSDNQWHCVNGPAVITEDTDGQSRFYWINGKRHRENGPAVEYASGGKEWWFNGQRHRKDGPAVETNNGKEAWWLDGMLHRTDGPAITYANGGKEYWVKDHRYTLKEFSEMSFEAEIGQEVMWYGSFTDPSSCKMSSQYQTIYIDSEGMVHKVGAPAVIGSEYESWCLHGRMHRDDGPAVIYSDGSKQWWLNGKQITKFTYGEYRCLIGSALLASLGSCVASALQVARLPHESPETDADFLTATHSAQVSVSV